MKKEMKIKSLEEFWPFYMSQHSKPETRKWHFVGTTTSILCLIYALLFNLWVLFLVPLVSYGLAWYSHFFIEKNIPATFDYPVWSLICDYKMFGFMLTGQMDGELKRLAVFWSYWRATKADPRNPKWVQVHPLPSLLPPICIIRVEEIT